MTLCNLQIHWLYISFAFLSLLNSMLFITCENPPSKCAKMTHQINQPKWPVKMSCHENLPNPPARITRQIHLPEIPPFPAQNPQAGHGSPTLPPPPTAPPMERGEGAGSRPGPPTHIEQVLFLSFSHLMNGNIFMSTQYIHNLHRAD